MTMNMAKNHQSGAYGDLVGSESSRIDFAYLWILLHLLHVNIILLVTGSAESIPQLRSVVEIGMYNDSDDGCET